jgi:hypothetical protein
MRRARSSCSGECTIAYPLNVPEMPWDMQFAGEAGERFEQAFVLCSFASELAGKASE